MFIFTYDDYTGLKLPVEGNSDKHNWSPIDFEPILLGNILICKYHCMNCKMLGNLIVEASANDGDLPIYEYWFEIVRQNEYDECGPRYKFKKLLE